MALETSVEQASGRVPITVVALDGELDASNFTALIEQVRGLYDAGTRHLLLDLTGLRFMASSGLVALHSIVRLMHGEPPPDPEAGLGRAPRPRPGRRRGIRPRPRSSCAARSRRSSASSPGRA